MTKPHSIYLSFEDNTLLGALFGGHNQNLEKLEKGLGISISSRGEMVALSGDQKKILLAESVLRSLYERLERGHDVQPGDVDAAIRMLSQPAPSHQPKKEKKPMAKNGTGKEGKEKRHTAPHPAKETLEKSVIQTPKKRFTPYSHKQAEYMDALLSSELVFAAGPAGTGKTYIAVAAAVALFCDHQVERIILSRPAVEAGERLGFLPGDLKDKVDPYLRPIYDALYDMLPAEKVLKYISTGEIEIAPLAYMRGRTLRNAYVILDEAQNSTPIQMKMFLTRLGEGSRMVVTGDLTQTDLPRDMKSGFRDALEKLEHLEEVKVIKFTAKEIVRHPLTTKIVQAYEKHDKPSKWENG